MPTPAGELEFPGFSGQTLASCFSRRSDAEVQAPDPGESPLGLRAFIKAHRDQYSVQMMCRVLEVAVSGYYDWLKQPISNHDQEDARLLQLIRASFIASHGIYGAPRVFLDL
jgi:hypothetical protein